VIRPAGTEKCLVGEWSVQPYPIQIRDCFFELVRLEQYRTDDEIGLVTDRQLGRIICRYLACAIQLLQRLLAPTLLQVCDAEVIRSETGETLGILQSFQDVDRLLGTALREINIGSQEFDVITYRLGDLAIDTPEGAQSVSHLSFLEMNPRQPVGSIVTNRLIHGTFENGLDRTPRPVVHPVA
jgi:hypothetical protein